MGSKILLVSDIHGDLEALDVVRNFASVASDDEYTVMASPGDFLAPIFNKEEGSKLAQGQQILYKIRSQNEVDNTLEQLAKKIPEAFAENYLEAIRKARKETGRQYEELSQVLQEFNLPLFLVPGNWDPQTLQDNDFFRKRCLHDVPSKNLSDLSERVERDSDGDLSFAGFGGSREVMAGILPIDLEYNFSSEEAYENLARADGVDVVITHTPPGPGLKELESSKRHIGDYGIRSFAAEYNPTILLCGHDHSPKISKVKNSDTIVINPGKLGRYRPFTDSDYDNGFGNFAVVELDDNTFFKSAYFYHIQDLAKGKASIEEIGKHERKAEKELQELIIRNTFK